MEVLEHVADPVKLMAELVRIGKPRARYLITVPDPSQEHLQKHVARPAYFQEPYHLRIFERADFAALVTQAGLRIERRQYYGAFWSVWYLLFWQANAEDPVTASSHPLLQSWTRTWAALLESEGGLRAKQVLDRLLPKSQAIVAVKPE
jgi:SAM-dependent methyltransferase